jgi:hypothetical protein
LPGERIHIADGKIWVNGAPVEPPESLRDVLHYTDHLEFLETDVRRFAVQLARSGAKPGLLNPTNFTVQDLYQQLEGIRERLSDQDPGALSDEAIAAVTVALSPVSLNIVRQLLGLQQGMTHPMRYGILPDDAYSLVPENCYLVCGDNSANSADGRFFGWLPNDHILGRAFCIWWPPSRIRDFTGFSRTGWGMTLLYGLPALIIVYNVRQFVRARLRKTRARE